MDNIVFEKLCESCQHNEECKKSFCKKIEIEEVKNLKTVRCLNYLKDESKIIPHPKEEYIEHSWSLKTEF